VDASNPPLAFANRVIREIMDNVCGKEQLATREDYLTIRLAFRHIGGSWEAITQGSPAHTRALGRLVKAWAKIPGRQQQIQHVYDVDP
jgi:hypothetical protein